MAKARTKSASGGNTLRGRVQSVTNAVSHGWELICACDVVTTFCCKLISLTGEEIELSALSRHPLQVQKFSQGIHGGRNLDRVNTLHYQSSDFCQDLKEVMMMMIFADHFD